MLLQNYFKYHFENSGIKIQMCGEREHECSPILKEQGRVEDNSC